MTLHNYVPTRTFELVVQSLDIARATGPEPPAFDNDLLADVVTLAARIAVTQGQGQQLLLALTRRSAWPADCCVV